MIDFRRSIGQVKEFHSLIRISTVTSWRNLRSCQASWQGTWESKGTLAKLEKLAYPPDKLRQADEDGRWARGTQFFFFRMRAARKLPRGPDNRAGKKIRLHARAAVNSAIVNAPKRNVGINELSAKTDNPIPITPQL